VAAVHQTTQTAAWWERDILVQSLNRSVSGGIIIFQLFKYMELQQLLIYHTGLTNQVQTREGQGILSSTRLHERFCVRGSIVERDA
jgi:hypothetical protein